MAVFPSAEFFFYLFVRNVFFSNVAFDVSRLQTSFLTHRDEKSFIGQLHSKRCQKPKNEQKRKNNNIQMPWRHFHKVMFFFLLSLPLPLMSFPCSFSFLLSPLLSRFSLPLPAAHLLSSVFAAPVNLMPGLPARPITVRQTHSSTGKCESAKSDGREEVAETENRWERERDRKQVETI